MSRNGTLLPIPEGSELAEVVQDFIDAWPLVAESGVAWPRSKWLGSLERYIATVYPMSSRADRKLTARHYAPFPLRDGHDVP